MSPPSRKSQVRASATACLSSGLFPRKIIHPVPIVRTIRILLITGTSASIALCAIPTLATANDSTSSGAQRAVASALSEEYPSSSRFAVRTIHCRQVRPEAFSCTFPEHNGKLGGYVASIYHSGRYEVAAPTYDTVSESTPPIFTPAFFTALLTVAIGFITAVIAVLQLRRILRAVRISQEANSLQAVMHCSSRYYELIIQVPNLKHPDIPRWLNTLWDLMSVEFFYFRRGFLDRDMFELWMVELAANYGAPFGPALPPSVESHHEYLGSKPRTIGSPAYIAMIDFFTHLMRISEVDDASQRSYEVEALISTFAPRKKPIWRGRPVRCTPASWTRAK